MKQLKLFIPLIIFVVLALFFWQGLGRDPSELPSALIGKPLPEFERQTVKAPQKTITQKDLMGHDFALINVWATWCGPCRQEHPFLIQLQEQGIPIYGVNAKDQLPAARQWLEQRGDPYVFSIFDPEGRLGLDMGVYGYPETFLIDGDGNVQLRKAGVLSPKVWEQEFQPVIDQLAQQ